MKMSGGGRYGFGVHTNYYYPYIFFIYKSYTVITITDIPDEYISLCYFLLNKNVWLLKIYYVIR